LTIAEYAHKNKLTYDEYNNLKLNIKELAKVTLDIIKQLHKPDTGVYYPITEIIHPLADHNTKTFIYIIFKIFFYIK
jgi:hypothetical protein